MTKKGMKKQKKSRLNIKEVFQFFITNTPGEDNLIKYSMFTLIGFGLIMIGSANVGQGNEIFRIVLMQIAYILIGYLLSCLCNRLFTFSRNRVVQLVIVPLVWILLTLASFSPQVNGSSAWLRLGPASIQPSEFMKPLAILMVANAIFTARKKESRQKNWFTLYRFPLFSFILCNILLFKQNDLGTLFIIDFIYFVCVITPDLSILRNFRRVVVSLFVLGIGLVIGFCVLCYRGYDIYKETFLEHIAVRVQNTINPYNDIYQKGYQPVNALYGIGDSNIVGKGLGNSSRKYGYLTQADTDYIFSLAIEETGIFGLLIIVTCYMMILWRLFYYALKSSDSCLRVVLVGNMGYVFIHFFLNVGGVACLIPLTGIPLLFVSRGGSALLSVMVSMGICQKAISVIRKKEII